MDRELKRFEAAIAHDLNNVLQVLMGNLELLKRRREFVPEIVEAALGATRKAAHYTDRLLALGRMGEQAPRPFELNRLLRDLEQMFEHTLGDAIAVQFDLAADVKNAHADPRALQMALLELATNARAAMARGGRLVLRSANAPPYVLLEIADTGSGMAPEAAARALAASVPTPGAKLGGLGLQIVQRCVGQAGGRVELETAPGAGTRVKLYLPAA
jgi:signal transduction histidine kinase